MLVLHHFSTILINEPSKQHYSKCFEEGCVVAVVRYTESFPEAMKEHVLCHILSTHRISLTTVCCWYSHYLLWGEYEHLTKQKIKWFNKKYRMYHHTNKIVSTLNSIVDKNPEFCIVEIAGELVKHANVYLPLSTIYKVLKEKLNNSIQVCYKSTKQRNKLEWKQYKATLKSFMKNVGQVLVIDEALIDKRVSR